MLNRICMILTLLIPLLTLNALTIDEKERQFKEGRLHEQKSLGFYLEKLNQELSFLRNELGEKYREVNKFHELGAPEDQFKGLLEEVAILREKIASLEGNWRELAVGESKKDDEGYALWDQEQTTLSQLVMDYGASDYLYVVPPEMAAMKLNLHSSIPIPRESWTDLLEIILSHNGIGIKKLNPYTRQLFVLKQDLIAVGAILSEKIDLYKVPDGERVAFVFSPSPEEVAGVAQFFERFRDPKRTFIYQIGFKIAIVSSKEEVHKLLDLYDAVWEKENERMTQVVPLKKVPPSEMEKILTAFFGKTPNSGRPTLKRSGIDDLTLISLKEEGSIVLIGRKEMVLKAEEIISLTENQIIDPCEMAVYWYTCKHSDPVEIAELLEKVYLSLIHASLAERDELNPTAPSTADAPAPPLKCLPPTYGPPASPPVVSPPVVVAATAKSQQINSQTMNFIPYPKTGSIMMVVRKDTLQRIKELLRKLDVPKRMVQIDVLLFEKKINNQNNFGLNVLKLGTPAKNVKETGLSYDASGAVFPRGILQFFISRAKSKHFPAFDLAYNFLMTQEDVRINSSPSITTLNQTPAQISIVEEISINNGAAPLETQTGITFEKSFSRQQYGTTIVITPTIHEAIEEDGELKRFVTLESNVTFDTIQTDLDDRPNVNRRHVENFVRVLDGETVILGGLRRKTANDKSEKIPFLGELPGLAKFFGTSRLRDRMTEMFIFITPQIILDPDEELRCMRNRELMKRPGDIPEFLARIEEAKKLHKRRLFANSFRLMFGKVDDAY